VIDPQLRASSAHVLVEDLDAPAVGDDVAHHLWRVLRLRDGEAVTVTDGQGAWRPCRVSGRDLEVVGPIVVSVRPVAITIAVAIPKQDRPEWVVQKLTELGVDRIVFLHAERSVVRWEAERAERHLVRLRRVAVDAAMQSRRVWLPDVLGPVDAREVLATMPAADPTGRALGPSDVAVAVGPEGGWTADELALARDVVTLGDNVLRIETAALAGGVRLTALRT
jgi:16S rRNA (uracil1498-N3)-methyltransferase